MWLTNSGSGGIIDVEAKEQLTTTQTANELNNKVQTTNQKVKMNIHRARKATAQGYPVYADLDDGRRYRIIGIGQNTCRTMTGLVIALSSVLFFN